MVAILKPWLAGVVRCQVCGELGVYSANGQKCPRNWIKLDVFGVSGYVCSHSCITEARVRWEKQRKALEDSKKLGPLLPPNVIL